MTARGQSLVVFALCLMLLTLMVAMTLSFGTMAKEKMEIEQAADRAAFSQAVATARTFNEIAVYNRALVGQMVSLLGVQSALSYAAMWRAYVNAMLKGYFDVGEQLGRHADDVCAQNYSGSDPCDCPNVGRAMAELYKDRIKPLYGPAVVVEGSNSPYEGEYDRLMRGWQGPDGAAGDQVRTLQGYAAKFLGAQKTAFDTVLISGNLQGSKLARALVGKAAAGQAEWGVVNETVSLKEVRAAVVTGGEDIHAVRAAMGSRGHPFVTRRLGGAQTLMAAMNALPVPAGEGPITEPRYQGSSFFGPVGYPAGHSNTVPTSNHAYAWGDDHMVPFVVSFKPQTAAKECGRSWKAPDGAYAFVKSTDKDEVTDQHLWEPKYIAKLEDDPPYERHTTAPCRINLPAGGWVPCISVWVNFMDYEPSVVSDKGDVFGQPKNFAAVKRDYSVRKIADPWNLAFRFRFGAGEVFALRGSKSSPRAGSNQIILSDGTDISVQSTVSTGIAYYHRMNHWKEPPNLFNPFWRAGLVHADVDGSGEGDFRSQISASAPWAGEAFVELRAQGWAGIP